MPRPGPRPYECVRRAWHSDRHQPMRGSLIQEIFRVVNEIHSSATKKNKEWQEKLPVVVLKAEEIMYSKANSEAEYMDLKTLWDRTNDAVNTIIRRDESTENGEFLQPCIEAALNLGCTPRRASRSQRNVNPRCYLTPNSQEPIMAENTGQGNHTVNSEYAAYYLNFMKLPTTVSTNLASELRTSVAQNRNCGTNKFPFASDNVCPSKTNQHSRMENCPASALCSVYPLYYGNCFQCEEPQHDSGVLWGSVSNRMVEPVRMVGFGSSFISNTNVLRKVSRTHVSNIPERSLEGGCDLALRLGPVSVPCLTVTNGQFQEVGHVNPNSQDQSTPSFLTPPIDKELSFFSKGNMGDWLNSSSNEWRVNNEHMIAEATMRKRKAEFSHPVEDQQFH